LHVIAKPPGLVVDEGDFEDSYAFEPFFTEAVEGKLIGYTPGSAQSTFYRIYLRPEGWRALGMERKPSLAERIAAFFHF
jgi:hypothetical protein